MKVIKAQLAGFCPGVKIAWQKAIAASKKNSVFILGDLIHNRQAIKRLEKQGVAIIKDLKRLPFGSRVVIRAHGEPKATYEQLKNLRSKLIDATCFRVRKVQEKAAELEKEGYQVLVCGKKSHPEVKATIGHTKKGRAIQSVAEAKKLKIKGKVALISQTTFSSDEFEAIKQVLKKKKNVDLKAVGTICRFTQAAQEEAIELAKKVDYLVVVGGRHSSNTKRLKEVGEKICPTYHLETIGELNPGWFKGQKTVGLLAGASTPDWIVEEIEEALRKI